MQADYLALKQFGAKHWLATCQTFLIIITLGAKARPGIYIQDWYNISKSPTQEREREGGEILLVSLSADMTYVFIA